MPTTDRRARCADCQHESTLVYPVAWRRAFRRLLCSRCFVRRVLEIADGR